MESRPSIIATDQVIGLVLTRVSREYVVVLLLEYLQAVIISVRDVDKIVMSEKSIWSNKQAGLWYFLKICRMILKAWLTFDFSKSGLLYTLHVSPSITMDTEARKVT